MTRRVGSVAPLVLLRPIADRLVDQAAKRKPVIQSLTWCLNEHDRHQFLLWVHPEGGACRAAPVVFADAARIRGHARLSPHSHSQPEAIARPRREVRSLRERGANMVGGH